MDKGIHILRVDEAVTWGILEALIISFIRERTKEKAEKDIDFRDGVYWYRCSLPSFHAQIPYASEFRIKNALYRLAKRGKVLVRPCDINSTDRTSWYALND